MVLLLLVWEEMGKDNLNSCRVSFWLKQSASRSVPYKTLTALTFWLIQILNVANKALMDTEGDFE